MRLSNLVLLLLLFVSASRVSAQTSAQPLLPNAFGPWTSTSQSKVDPTVSPSGSGGTAATDPASLAAAAAREYGTAGGERTTYARAGSSSPVKVTLYRMKDVSGAYGEYSYLRTPDMQRADFTEHSFVKPDGALILLGNLVVQIDGVDPVKNGGDIHTLLTALGSHADQGPLPGLPEHLPLANRVNQSDHYILGPQTLDQFFPGQLGYSLGFAYGTEVETAKFHANGHDVTLLIADFPTPQIARAQLESLQKKFNINGSLASAASSPQLFASRSQTMIAMVAGASSSEEASKLLDQVKAGTVLTWSEPTFQFKEPPIELMIVGAIVGSGVICLFAAVAGLAFGGFRLGIKKLFPGRVFDRNSQVDFLQLALNGKPIKAEDFYGFEGFGTKGEKVDRHVPDRTALRIFK